MPSPASGYKLQHCVDVIFCVDTSKSMESFISEMQKNIHSFYHQYAQIEEMNGFWAGDSFRIKIIAFRGAGTNPVITESPFFVMEEDVKNLQRFVDDLEVSGNEDDVLSALSAFSLAMDSDWIKEGRIVRRYVIMMITDKIAAFPDENTGQTSLDLTVARLRKKWDEKMAEKRAKRFLIFAPDAKPWSDMVDWVNTFHTPSADVDIESCAHLLAKSI